MPNLAIQAGDHKIPAKAISRITDNDIITSDDISL